MASSRMKPEIYIAVVNTVNEDWSITFKIPKIIDYMECYPTAFPLCDHIFQLYVGDEVYIFSNGDPLNNQFYYLPITIRKFSGIRHNGSFIDVTRPDITDVQTTYLYKFMGREESRIEDSIDISNKKIISTNELIIKLPIDDPTFEETKSKLNRSPNELKPGLGGSIKISMTLDGGINIECDKSVNINASEVRINGVNFSNHTHDPITGLPVSP